MKKICVCLVTFILFFSLMGLYGCGGGGDDGGNTSTAPVDETGSPVDPSTPPPDDPAVKMFNAGDSPWVSDIIEDSSGNILAVSSDENDTHITVLKLDSSGTQLFNRYTDSGNMWLNAVNIFETDSGYKVTGSIDAINGSLFTMNVDANINFSGALIYDCANRGSTGNDSVRLSDGSIIFAGFTDQEANCSAFIDYGNALMTGINSSATQYFRVDYNMTVGNSDEFMAIVDVSSGGLAAAGSTNVYDDGSGYGGPKNTILVRTGATGTTAWVKNFGYQTDDGGNTGAIDLVETSDGGFAILARSGYAYAMYVIRTDADGNVLWEKNAVSGDSSYIARKFIQAEDNGFVIVGQGADSEGAVVKLDSSGTKVWEYNMEGQATAIALCSGGGYVVAGNVTPEFAVDKTFVLKLDADGNRIW